VKPAFASAIADARPIPLPAPVTSATCVMDGRRYVAWKQVWVSRAQRPILVHPMLPLKLAAVAGATVLLASHSGPQRYYLALGDSIAYGIQPAKVTAGLPPSGFRTGYVDVFAKRLRTLAPKLQVVNYSCPGESTKTFVAGLCPWTVKAQKLHDQYRGGQLAAALSFLRTHGGQVSPITITLWSNDITELSDACGGSLICIKARAPRALGQFAARLASILSKLRAAAPAAVIVVTGTWNNDVAHLAQTDPLYRSLDATMKRVAAGAKARYAELFPTFNPPGSLAREKARICALTFVCSADDGHPTDAGYRAIAAAVWSASGY